MSVHPGLCGRCRHARVIASDRGSRFWLCRAAPLFPELRKYPALPVLACRGFEPEGPGVPHTPPPVQPDPETA